MAMAKVDITTIKETFGRFGADDASTLAAAIAYSTVFAIAPLLVVAIAIAGEAFGVANGGHGHHIAEDRLIGAISSSAGAQTGATVRQMVDAAYRSHQGSVVAQVLGWVMFVIAASGLFGALQNALNRVWSAKPKQQGIWLTIRNRVASAGMLLAVGFLLIITTALNFALSFLWTHFTQLLPFPGAGVVFSIANWIVDIGIIAMMFALIFKYLPDTDIAWDDVKIGAVATAVLFVIGQALLGIYISHAGIANGYGAVGSLVVLLVWVYYSAMLLLIGAEFTRVYAEHHGSRADASRVATVRGEAAAGTPLTAAPRSR